MNNMVTLKEWYTENDAGNLVYVCDYIYTYDFIGSMGISDHSALADAITIYPNPSADHVSALGDKTTITNIDVLDNTGRVILKTSDINRSNANLDISALTSGVYYMRLYTYKGIVTKKLIKQ